MTLTWGKILGQKVLKDPSTSFTPSVYNHERPQLHLPPFDPDNSSIIPRLSSLPQNPQMMALNRRKPHRYNTVDRLANPWNTLSMMKSRLIR